MFFFFQAEDGIRDLTVTGVQTCALPIFTDQVRQDQPSRCEEKRARDVLTIDRIHLADVTVLVALDTDHHELSRQRHHLEIGRASCRERGSISVLAITRLRTEATSSTAPM